jgi:hypothetical protein
MGQPRKAKNLFYLKFGLEFVMFVIIINFLLSLRDSRPKVHLFLLNRWLLFLIKALHTKLLIDKNSPKLNII